MNLDSLAASRRHSHAFNDGNPIAEHNTRRAMALTLVMMVVEIAGGWWFNSMALLADGWHMSSHALALGLSAFAYACARRYAEDHRFAFGTWKIEILGGYTSAILLLGVAALMAVQSVDRLFHPSAIHYPQAITIAIVGLAVNLLCVWWLRDHPAHSHGHHDHGHGHHHHGHDLNQRSAYLHVAADAATSVLAIVALFGGMYFGAVWLDPVMGLVGAALVSLWAWGLIRDSSRILLDAEMDAPVVAEIREAIEGGEVPARISDLHVWQVGRGKFACAAEVVTPSAVDSDHFRRAICVHEEIVHATIEVRNAPIGAVAA
ncbi:cation diffusion facilitator family transporter [Tahibacter aquaticus]|uniref:Cation diffusion facilitator family transporter n=1 Tax=Tahibacter aquaticus TaxID=520092 RepID=A0A4R6Z234_9GAMM|nr:CDF family Co(II)/Ni(II) efflux transporter DmeF [Tahibacter aquaticus]TDR45622.1 cation diffusion facilitator family transporter [Tahibacter aquaticus]